MSSFLVKVQTAHGVNFVPVDAPNAATAVNLATNQGLTVLGVENAPNAEASYQSAHLAELAAMRQELATIRRRTPRTFSWVRVLALLAVITIILIILL